MTLVTQAIGMSKEIFFNNLTMYYRLLVFFFFFNLFEFITASPCYI